MGEHPEILKAYYMRVELKTVIITTGSTRTIHKVN